MLTSGDGLLVLDRNHDGTINSGAELFGSATTLADGVISEDEISNILTLAEALDIPMEKAVARMLFRGAGGTR